MPSVIDIANQARQQIAHRCAWFFHSMRPGLEAASFSSGCLHVHLTMSCTVYSFFMPSFTTRACCCAETMMTLEQSLMWPPSCRHMAGRPHRHSPC
jgi:hypothetical protein